MPTNTLNSANDNPVWRSLMFVPVNVERFVSKAHTRGADAIQLDLEDSVAIADKPDARKLVQEAAETVAQAGADVVVRINQPLRMAIPDLEQSVSPRVQAIAVTKVDGPGHLRLLSEAIDELEAERGMENGQTKLIAMVETAEAFLRIDQIAKAHPRVVAMSLGSEDFATSIGTDPIAEVLTYPKQHGIIAARAAGITPLGLIGTVADYNDVDGMRETIRRSRRFGFQGASCVHPKIVPLLNEEFRPTPEEVANAKKIIDAFEEAVANGRASLEVDGKMVDYPVVYRAENLLAIEEGVKKREAKMEAAS
ncbi:MAG: CoA ester lyase [Rhodospirillaceae bacterium]|nr:CoA ester lyase [Rhodospirillaceae bacterium]MBL25793.1 CoA ester lyase [Rhodospirillaceae bacterium]HAA92311.1 CoA ester lyase [Rhodospirillaceae bacterium]